jgi:hypothetical protein
MRVNLMNRPIGDPNILEGDITVSAVPGGNHIIGRINSDGRTSSHLGTQADVGAALKQACSLVGPDNRVFLYPNANSQTYEPVDCSKISN